MNLLTIRLWANFAKWSKPKPKPNKVKEGKKSFAMGDEKAAKLSKSEQEQQNKQKAMQLQQVQEETKRKISVFYKHDKSLEQFMSARELETIRIQQLYYLKGKSEKARTTKQLEPPKPENAKYLISDNYQLTENNERRKKQPVYGNYTSIINEQYKGSLQEIAPSMSLRRMGSIGIKLGMTTMWNRWGHIVPVTVVELDRVQVVQVKPPNVGNQFWQVQMGFGQKNMKRITKPLLGHYIKAGVPPKRRLMEFKVSKECLLPVGYMMGARHYTPGMFIDVVGKTVGHGFQGTIKKEGFRRQPASHGNSLTTRVLGSTGCRQDPGRVFKLKKMYGQMGNRITTQTGLQIFKIDVDKNLLYVKGSIPGKAGSIIKIRDTLNSDKLEKNLELVHYPTFVEEEGKKYARQFSMYCGERDPDEIEVHDNAYILDDEGDDGGAGSVTDNKDALPED